MANTKGSDNPFPSVLFAEHVDPATPAAGTQRVFVDTDGDLKKIDDAAVVTTYGGAVSEILDIPTAETDDTLVLAPDGAGGVEFRAEAGGGSSGIVQASRVTRTAGDVTTTSSTFANATGLTSTITTGAHRCLLQFTGSGGATSTNEMGVSFAVDGTRVDAATYGLLATTGQDRNQSITYLTDVLSAGSHTFTVQFKVSGGTGTIYASGTAVAVLTVIETGLTV